MNEYILYIYVIVPSWVMKINIWIIEELMLYLFLADNIIPIYSPRIFKAGGKITLTQPHAMCFPPLIYWPLSNLCWSHYLLTYLAKKRENLDILLLLYKFIKNMLI